MTGAEVQVLYAFNRWASDRMLRAAEALSPEEFTRDMKSSYPSIAATLAHILAAEWVWLARWNGVSPKALPADWSNDGYRALVDHWRGHELEQSRFLDSLDDARIAAPVSYTNIAGQPFTVPLHVLLRHVVNHSSYHRGQVTTMLRQLGFPAPATDLVLYHTSLAPSLPAQ